MEKIMPEEEYSEFKEVRFIERFFQRQSHLTANNAIDPKCSLQMILQKDFHAIYALANVCGQDRTLLASLLLRIFRHEKAEAPLLRTLNDREINMEGKNHKHRD